MDTFIILSFLTCLVDAPGLLHYFQLLFPSMSHRKGLAPSQQLFHSKPSFSSDFITSSFCIIISFCTHLYKAHILIKVDIFCSKSVNELLMVVRWKIGKDDGDDEEEEWHGRVSKWKNSFCKNYRKMYRGTTKFFSLENLTRRVNYQQQQKVECKARFETVGHGGWLRQCHRVPIFFFTSDLTNIQNSDCETSWLVYLHCPCQSLWPHFYMKITGWGWAILCNSVYMGNRHK